MKRSIAYMFLVAILTVFAGVANAGTITLVGGSPGTIPAGSATNEYIAQFGFSEPIGGYYDANVTVNLLQSTLFTFEFFGAEAEYLNEFWSGVNSFAHPGGTLLAPSLSEPLASFSLNISDSGILPFEFWIDGDSTDRLANGDNPGNIANFFASFDPFDSTAGAGGITDDVLYVFLDDGGAGPDDNHDDFLVRIAALGPAPPPIPEPKSFLLLGTGLAILWLGTNRRRKK